MSRRFPFFFFLFFRLYFPLLALRCKAHDVFHVIHLLRMANFLSNLECIFLSHSHSSGSKRTPRERWCESQERRSHVRRHRDEIKVPANLWTILDCPPFSASVSLHLSKKKKEQEKKRYAALRTTVLARSNVDLLFVFSFMVCR